VAGRRRVGDVLPLRLKPFLDPDNRAFWTGGADGALMVHRCADCGWWIHPPRPRCRRCRSARVSPQRTVGRGRVVTFTVNHQPWIPGSDLYIVALVELEEQPGLFLTTNLVDTEAEEVELGMPVEVVFEDAGDGVHLPLFRPVGDP
jgi:uncharacterized OB-fold protein